MRDEPIDVRTTEVDAALEMLALKDEYIADLERANRELEQRLELHAEAARALRRGLEHERAAMDALVEENASLRDQLMLHQQARRLYRLAMRTPVLRQLLRAYRLARS